MATRIPVSQRAREELVCIDRRAAFHGIGKGRLGTLATRLVVEEALESEASDVVGRDYYAHGAQPGQGYRNGYRVTKS